MPIILQHDIDYGMRYAVLGGAGAMGRITVTDLFHTCSSQDEILIADYDLEKAEALAMELLGKRKGQPKLSPVFANARELEPSAAALAGAGVLINATQYQLNLAVMELALRLGAHYVDLGGLFHVTMKQLKLHSRFADVGLTALLGMGAAPGITNLLAAAAASRMESVREIHCRVGSMDRTRYEPVPALAVAYSLKTILDEFSFQPAVFTKGKLAYVVPMSGDSPHRFPAPIGVRRPMYTIHSEVATLPESYAAKGVREVSFKIAFDPVFTDRVRFLRDLGLASHDPVTVMGPEGEARVAPVDLVNVVAMSQPSPRRVGPLRQHEVVRSVVKGVERGRKVTYVVDCHTSGMPAWGMGLDIDTGTPPAIAAQMLADGEITARGALAPEIAVDPARFFARLKKRRFQVVTSRKSGWTLKV